MAAPEPTANAAAAQEATAAAPLIKKRKGLMGFAVASQKMQVEAEGQSLIDVAVKAEIDKFAVVNQGILSTEDDDFRLSSFWAAHKSALPLHFGVYVAEVGCKKAASSNVETVFSGAGKFTEEAKNTRPTLLRRMVKLHYNWKYEFLRPSIKQVEARYLEKWPRGTAGQTAAAAKRATEAVAAAATAKRQQGWHVERGRGGSGRRGGGGRGGQRGGPGGSVKASSL